MSSLNLALGTGIFYGPENVQSALDAAKAAGIVEIDTAEAYGENEAELGAVKAAEQGFAISTKNPGGIQAGEALKEIAPRFEASLAKLNVTQVDIFYVHAPDRTLPLSEWVPALHDLYKQGRFQRFGLSNFSPDEVREVHSYAASNGFVLPTVYQGNYNPVARGVEDTLFPVLRELKIVFYAYSPMAGGFLTKTRAALEEGSAQGRWSTGDNFIAQLYRGSKLIEQPFLLRFEKNSRAR